MITGMTIDAGASLAPAFMLTLNSQDITSNFSDRLISLTMTDNRVLRLTSSTLSSTIPTEKSNYLCAGRC